MALLRQFWRLGVVVAGGFAACAPPVDIAAEERAIRATNRQWVDAVAARDSETVARIFAEDGHFLGTCVPRLRGRAAIRSAWAELLRLPNLSLTFAPDVITVSRAGDIAYETGRYVLAYDAPRERIEHVGKYVVTWKKAGGEWKVAMDIYNSDRPPGC